MTIKELLQHQNETRNICLLRQGLFFRAYNESALLFRELFGYQVKCKQSKSCDEMLYYIGFPASAVGRVVDKVVDRVVDRVTAQGGKVLKQEDGYLELSGIVSSLDVNSLAELSTPSRSRSTKLAQKSQSFEPPHSTVIESLRAFDLSNSTPLQSLQFIGRLQQALNEKQN